MPPSKRMTANPVRPARHRPGKPGAAAAVASSSSDEDSEDSEAPDDAPKSKSKTEPTPASASASAPSSLPKSTAQLSSGLKKVDLARDAVKPGALSDAQRKTLEDEFETESSEDSEEEEDDDESGSGSEEESSAEESSSEDEARRRKLMRPVFMKKRGANGSTAAAEMSEEQKFAQEMAKQKAKKDATIQEQAERYQLEKAEEKVEWDDDKVVDEVDDTDGLDPEAERTAWKLRELRRIKRERDSLIEREKEREEIERRRNLTAEEREAEDNEFLAKQQEERDGRGKIGFRQKYFHKGAFFADDSKAAGLDRRDVMGGRYADDVADKSALPEFMQIRDMTRLGKKGRTRYKDLKTEDTGRFADYRDSRRPNNPDLGVDDRFRPDYDKGGGGATGANASALGERKRTGSVERRDVKRSKLDA